MSDAARIDVHQHLLPPVYTAALERHGLGRWAPQPWSPAAALAMMDTHEIATGVLSLSTPGSHLGDDAEGRQLARAVNRGNAEALLPRRCATSPAHSTVIPRTPIDRNRRLVR
jgi:6-methylsalicylate decarboxylase